MIPMSPAGYGRTNHAPAMTTSKRFASIRLTRMLFRRSIWIARLGSRFLGAFNTLTVRFSHEEIQFFALLVEEGIHV